VGAARGAARLRTRGGSRRPLRDFYFTLLNGVYDLGAADFGVNKTGAPISMIEQLLV
jgi:hypothetical protein